MKLKIYESLKLPGMVVPKKYKMYYICVGCGRELIGRGVEIFGVGMHINIICVLNSLYWHWKLKTRNYD